MQFDWNRARAFLVAAEEGSFSAAARALATSQPTVGRQVAALEEELGVTLFERVGKRLELTASGLDLVEHVRKMGEAANQVSLRAHGQATSVEGPVAITASEVISTFLLPLIVLRLRRAYPGIVLEILAFDRGAGWMAGLAHMGITHPPERFPIVTANHLTQWALCVQGAGLCFMLREVGDAAPRVQRVLPDLAMPVPLWLVSHRELRTSRRIRLVFDLLGEALDEEHSDALARLGTGR